MEEYLIPGEFATEEEALAKAKARAEENRNRSVKMGSSPELNDWVYVVGPDGNGYRVN